MEVSFCLALLHSRPCSFCQFCRGHHKPALPMFPTGWGDSTISYVESYKTWWLEQIFKSWLIWNISNEDIGQVQVYWSSFFGVAVYEIWKDQNSLVFFWVSYLNSSLFYSVLRQAQSINKVNLHDNSHLRVHKKEVAVSWSNLFEIGIKLTCMVLFELLLVVHHVVALFVILKVDSLKIFMVELPLVLNELWGLNLISRYLSSITLLQLYLNWTMLLWSIWLI